MRWHDFLTGIKFTAVAGTLAHIFGLVFPKKLLCYNYFPFKEYCFEEGGSFYNKFRISKWMTKVPDMSRYVPYMFRKRLDKKMTSEHILKYIRETCLAELVHLLLIFSSPILFFSVRGIRGVVYTLIYSLCNLPFVIIQRYNRPKLIRLYRRQLKREAALTEREALE